MTTYDSDHFVLHSPAQDLPDLEQIFPRGSVAKQPGTGLCANQSTQMTHLKVDSLILPHFAAAADPVVPRRGIPPPKQACFRL